MEIKDYGHINQEELKWVKDNIKGILKPLLPYTAKNGIRFSLNSISSIITREGLIFIDNGCGVRRKDGRDYYLAFKYSPTFTNRAGYGANFRVSGDINEETLEGLAEVVERSIIKYAVNLTKGLNLEAYLREERLNKLLG